MGGMGHSMSHSHDHVDARIREGVDSKILQIMKDFISKQDHQSTLDAKVETVTREMAAKMEGLVKEHELKTLSTKDAHERQVLGFRCSTPIAIVSANCCHSAQKNRCS